MLDHNKQNQPEKDWLHTVQLCLSNFTDVPASSFNCYRKILKSPQCQSKQFIQDLDEYHTEKQLILKYLLTNNAQTQQTQLQKITNFFICNQPTVIMDFLHLQQFQDKNKNQALSHYLGCWLLSMKYTQKSNKKYILSRINFHLNYSALSDASKIYNSMFATHIPFDEIRLKLITDVCRYGWQYFIQEVVSILKLNMQQKGIYSSMNRKN